MKKYLVVLLFGLILCGCAPDQTLYVEQEGSETASSFILPETEESSAETEADTVYVYVCGAVKSPGVYELPEGSRICDAIEAAGGLKKKADAEAVNQASLLEDGQEILVPCKTEDESTGTADSGTAGTVQSADTSGKVNINTADAAQLETLTGIGEVKAQEIIAWRESNGAFSSTEDLQQVDGIGDKTFEKIKDEITVN